MPNDFDCDTDWLSLLRSALLSAPLSYSLNGLMIRTHRSMILLAVSHNHEESLILFSISSLDALCTACIQVVKFCWLLNWMALKEMETSLSMNDSHDGRCRLPHHRWRKSISEENFLIAGHHTFHSDDYDLCNHFIHHKGNERLATYSDSSGICSWLYYPLTVQSEPSYDILLVTRAMSNRFSLCPWPHNWNILVHPFWQIRRKTAIWWTERLVFLISIRRSFAWRKSKILMLLE